MPKYWDVQQRFDVPGCLELQILPKGANSVTATISPRLQESMPHAGLALVCNLNDEYFLQFHFWREFYVSFSFFIGFRGIFRFRGRSSYVSAKKAFLPLKRPCVSRKRGNVCGCGGN